MIIILSKLYLRQIIKFELNFNILFKLVKWKFNKCFYIDPLWTLLNLNLLKYETKNFEICLNIF